MKKVKVEVLKNYTRTGRPYFVFKKGQTVECIMTNKEAEIVKKEQPVTFYKIISIKKAKLK